jgi:hypothetical protein
MIWDTVIWAAMGNSGTDDLETDIQELTDVSSKYPEIVSRMDEIMKHEHIPAIQDRFRTKTLGD